MREQPVAIGRARHRRRPDRTAARRAVDQDRSGRLARVIAPQTQLVFTVAGSKTLALKKRTTIAARVKVSKPATLTATLSTSAKKKLYTWKVRHLKAGANVVKLTLPKQIRRPGTYTVTWIARAGKETVSRTVKLKLVGKNVAQIKKKP